MLMAFKSSLEVRMYEFGGGSYDVVWVRVVLVRIVGWREKTVCVCAKKLISLS